MSSATATRSEKIRERLDFPVIDADGHLMEFPPLLFDYLKETGGAEMSRKSWRIFGGDAARGWAEMTAEERARNGIMRPPFWGIPTKNKIDRATASVPGLMYERLTSFGIDFSILYPTLGLLLPHIPADDVRQASCRAYNMMVRDLFADYSDRLAPAAIVPCYTPEEAIDELEFAVQKLGLKAAMFGTLVRRPVEMMSHAGPDALTFAYWLDTLALNSLHNYDPLWQRCIDLKVAVTAHTSTLGLTTRRSSTNYMYNHVGTFSEAGQAFARALFFGGVTHRFPDLTFAFLEGGVSWACSLLCDFVERWKKRNREAVFQYDPAFFDAEHLGQMFDKYGGDLLRGRLSLGATGQARLPFPGASRDRDIEIGIDDFAATSVESISDICKRFVPNFYFGCEVDDTMTITAFDERLMPENSRLNAMMSSDMGHWDVTDMTRILEEAYGLVERGLMDEQNFRDFVFTNPAALHVKMNPEFFRETVVEDDVSILMDSAFCKAEDFR